MWYFSVGATVRNLVGILDWVCAKGLHGSDLSSVCAPLGQHRGALYHTCAEINGAFARAVGIAVHGADAHGGEFLLSLYIHCIHSVNRKYSLTLICAIKVLINTRYI